MISLVFWSITIVVSIKYVVFILRADNDGEGGVMALAALARKATSGRGRLVSRRRCCSVCSGRRCSTATA